LQKLEHMHASRLLQYTMVLNQQQQHRNSNSCCSQDSFCCEACVRKNKLLTAKLRSAEDKGTAYMKKGAGSAFVRAMRMQADCHLRVFEKLVNLHNTQVVLTTLICVADFNKVSQTQFHDLQRSDHLFCICVSFYGLYVGMQPLLSHLYVPACDATGANSLSCKVKV